MSALTKTQTLAFQNELLELMMCREIHHFISNEQEYADEPEERIEEFYETLCDPSFQNCTSDWLEVKKEQYEAARQA